MCKNIGGPRYNGSVGVYCAQWRRMNKQTDVRTNIKTHKNQNPWCRPAPLGSGKNYIIPIQDVFIHLRPPLLPLPLSTSCLFDEFQIFLCHGRIQAKYYLIQIKVAKKSQKMQKKTKKFLEIVHLVIPLLPQLINFFVIHYYISKYI